MACRAKVSVFKLATISLVGLALSPASATGAQVMDCPDVSAATPMEHLNRAIRDSHYGACFSGFADQQKAACAAQHSLGANQRQCQQIVITFQELGVKFQPGSIYMKSVTECAAKGSGPSCDTRAGEEKQMRCNLTFSDDCLPSASTLPKPSVGLDNDWIQK